MQSLCSWSLVELYRALESSVEAHKAVLAAHPMYANLMERALAKVVLQHVTTLEKFCQVRIATDRLPYCSSMLRLPESCFPSWQCLQKPLHLASVAMRQTLHACSVISAQQYLCKPQRFILSTCQ